MGKRRLALGGALALGLGFGALHFYDRPPSPPGGWLRDAGLPERFAVLEGHKVRFIRTGQGKAVLLLHGFASSIYTWKDVIPALALDHEVVALDLPGFGWSDQPKDLSFELFPKVAWGLLDALGLDRATLVGNSMGGAVAALLAAERPGRVEKLVLIDSAGFNLRPADRPAAVRLAAHPWAESALGVLPVRRLFVTRGLRQVFHDPARIGDERVNEYLAAAARPGTLAAIRSLGASAFDPQAFAELLRGVRAPTLVIWGGEDTWIPLAHADRFVSAIPGARKVVLPEVGHTPQEEAPEAVNALLREFLGAGSS
jgi:pimeloyl-ACP methyl ester carboxylesterase